MEFKKKAYLRLNQFWDAIRFPWIVFRLFMNPKNIDPIFKLGTFRDHPAFAVSAQKFNSDPSMMAMIKSRYLSPEKIDLEKLARMPDGTLGREFARFIQERNLDIDFYPFRQEVLDDEFLYVRRRCPQTHDIWHAVVGVSAEEMGEMKLSAFYVAQIRSPFNALYVGIGLFYALLKKPENLGSFFDAVTEGWTLGNKAKPLFAMRWEEMWDRPLIQIRRELNLPEVASGVASTVSVLHENPASTLKLRSRPRSRLVPRGRKPVRVVGTAKSRRA
jgi:ubiquinone biosynthesis protein COQ4